MGRSIVVRIVGALPIHDGSVPSLFQEDAPISDIEQAGDAQTPKHLWVVGIVTVLWNAGGAYDYVMSQTQNESYMSAFTPEQLEFFLGFPAWVVAAWAIAVWGGVLGSILLLMRKSLALPVFIASLVAMVLTTFQNYVLSNGLEVSGTGGLAFSAVIFMVAVALVFHGEQRSLTCPA